MTKIPAAWSFSTTHLGGTPTADTKRVVFSYIHRIKLSVDGNTGHTWRTIWTHFDDNVDQLGKLTLLVVVLKQRSKTVAISLVSTYVG